MKNKIYKTFSVVEGKYYDDKKQVEFEVIEQYAKETYCRFFTVLAYPQIAFQNYMIEKLLAISRDDYSVVGIIHTETQNDHYHFVVGFTSSTNQKKSIYQVYKECLRTDDFVITELEFIDFVNHIRPIHNIKQSLLYLTHWSEGAISDNKKPYDFDEVFCAYNGNQHFLEKLYSYMKDIKVDDVKWSISDASRYIYHLVDTYNFKSQYDLQKYVTYDRSITDNQRNKVLSNWRTFFFAIMPKLNDGSKQDFIIND